MNKSEMRLQRRYLIGEYMQAGYNNIVVIMALVRISEVIRFGEELQAYK